MGRASHVGQAIAQQVEDVVVRVEDRAVEVVGDHALGLVEGRDLSLVVGLPKLLVGDDGGAFDDFDRHAVHVEDRVVGGLQPHLPSVAAEAPELAGLISAARELAPEPRIFGAVGVPRLDEHAVMPPHQRVERVAGRVQEGWIGIEDDAAHVEGDDDLGLVDGGDLPLEIGLAQLRVGDDRGILDHLERPSTGVEDGIVGGLQPDRSPVLADPPVFRGLVAALRQLGPEGRMVRAVAVHRVDEDAVVSSHDLVASIAHRVEEHGVGVLDDAVEGEVDDGLGRRDGGDLPPVAGLLALGLGDVARDLDDVPQCSGRIEARHESAAQPDLGATASGSAVVQADRPAPRHRGPQVIEPAMVAAKHESSEVEPGKVAPAVAEQGLEPGIGAQDAAVGREHGRREDGIERVPLGIRAGLGGHARRPARRRLPRRRFLGQDVDECVHERRRLGPTDVGAAPVRELVETAAAQRGMADQRQRATREAPDLDRPGLEDLDIPMAPVTQDAREGRLGGVPTALDDLGEPTTVQGQHARQIGTVIALPTR